MNPDMMTIADVKDIKDQILAAALAGADEGTLLRLLCEVGGARGLPIGRAILVADTLHPIYEGRAFRWRNDGIEEECEVAYGRTDEGEAAENWQRSIFYRMLQTGEARIRRRLAAEDDAEFEHLRELRAEGYTDYLAFMQPFGAGGAIGDLDCVFGYVATREPAGFPEAGIAALDAVIPTLTLAIKTASLARIAETLVEVYLGRDARERVLKGRIERGKAETIETVLWFSDLHGFTTITDTAAPEEIIPLLNDYSGAVIDAVHAAGGNVLKLIGDGVLAIFNFETAGEAAAAALGAEAELRRREAEIDARRRAEGRPATSVYIGLHLGEVFYGNIGSQDRLDFTVVGPCVNEVARIASMCRSVDRLVVASAAFCEALPPAERRRLVSVGRFALRGVGRAQELFTLDPELAERERRRP
ncbi:adenylate cyclase [Aureimonas endophytica]|uniref:Adenylate cyclase n=1 Tax=Aureimonas endophytica TaxID=2027858 RepID=A0A916ZYP1_9HYPH|nr:adenylate/guanylate cyclase domain-containing protein [Aureimonas endophytica]GGE17212.1 adenylate cyclase [Aureimonas endophytica]